LSEEKATPLSNEIIKRQNLKEDTSLGLVAKENGRSGSRGGRKPRFEYESSPSDQGDDGDGCYFCKKLTYAKDL